MRNFKKKLIRIFSLSIMILFIIANFNFATNKYGKEPTRDEMAEYLNVSTKTIDELLYYSMDTVSLSTLIGDDEDSELEDFIESDSLSPEDEALNIIRDENVDTLLNTLSVREKDIIKRRFGFDDMPCQTLEEVGSYYGLTRERIRQIEYKALKKLRIRAKKEELF